MTFFLLLVSGLWINATAMAMASFVYLSLKLFGPWALIAMVSLWGALYVFV